MMEQFPGFKALLSHGWDHEWTTWRLDFAPGSKTNSIPSQEEYRKPLGISLGTQHQVSLAPVPTLTLHS